MGRGLPSLALHTNRFQRRTARDMSARSVRFVEPLSDRRRVRQGQISVRNGRPGRGAERQVRVVTEPFRRLSADVILYSIQDHQERSED